MIRWTPEMDALLGTMGDKAAAERLGYSTSVVNVRRRELGVPPFRKHAGRAWEPPAELVAALGTARDRDLADRFGLTPDRVFRLRKELGLEAFRKHSPEKCRKVPEDLMALLGTVKDTVIAHRAGVSRAWVCNLRKERGIPRFRGPVKDRTGGMVGDCRVLAQTSPRDFRLRCPCGRDFDWHTKGGVFPGSNPRCGECRSDDWLKDKVVEGTNLTGVRFSHTQKGQKYWVFRCECGTEKAIQLANVLAKRQKSCGCLAKAYRAKVASGEIVVRQRRES